MNLQCKYVTNTCVYKSVTEKIIVKQSQRTKLLIVVVCLIPRNVLQDIVKCHPESETGETHGFEFCLSRGGGGGGGGEGASGPSRNHTKYYSKPPNRKKFRSKP